MRFFGWPTVQKPGLCLQLQTKQKQAAHALIWEAGTKKLEFKFWLVTQTVLIKFRVTENVMTFCIAPMDFISFILHFLHTPFSIIAL